MKLKEKQALSDIKTNTERMIQNHFLTKLIEDKKMIFNNLAFILIILDSIILCIDGTNFSNDVLVLLNKIDFALLIIFYIEMLIRIFLIPFFFKSFLNIIDFCLFIMNLTVQIYLCACGNNILDEVNNKTYLFARSFQILRIFRILIQNNYWKSISVLIVELIKIINELKELLFILLIFLMVFSLIGRDLFNFGNLAFPPNNDLMTRVNFDNFYNSFLANFLIFNDEEWPNIMFAHIQTFSKTYVFYFIINVMISTIFLNKMFLASFINKLFESKNVKKLLEESNEDTKWEVMWASLIKKIKIKSSKLKFYLNKLCFYKNKKEEMEKPPKIIINLQKIQKSQEEKNFSVKIKKFLDLLTNKNKYFDNFMIFIISLSLITLGLYDPYQPRNSSFNLTLKNIDIPIFIIFTLELVADIIAQGKKLKIFQISLKLFICIIFLLTFLYDMDKLKLLLICRLFLLFHFSKELQLAAIALLKSLSDILQLFFFFFLVSLLFALIGVKYFKGAFGYCSTLNDQYLEYVITKVDCFDFGGDWLDQDFNFNNIFKGLELLFLIANTEGWLSLM